MTDLVERMLRLFWKVPKPPHYWMFNHQQPSPSPYGNLCLHQVHAYGKGLVSSEASCIGVVGFWPNHVLSDRPNLKLPVYLLSQNMIYGWIVLSLNLHSYTIDFKMCFQSMHTLNLLKQAIFENLSISQSKPFRFTQLDCNMYTQPRYTQMCDYYLAGGCVATVEILLART